MQNRTFNLTCFCDLGVEVSIHSTCVLGSVEACVHHRFFALALLAKTVQFKLTQCIVHKKMTIRISYADRTGSNSADQGWTTPTRAGPG